MIVAALMGDEGEQTAHKITLNQIMTVRGVTAPPEKMRR